MTMILILGIWLLKASELGILKLSEDQRTFKWAKTDKKIMTVPFDEHPYSAFTAFLKQMKA